MPGSHRAVVAGRYRRLLFLIGTLRLGVSPDASRLSGGFAQFRVALRRHRAAPWAAGGERRLQLVLNFRETAIGRGSRCLLLAEHRDQRLDFYRSSGHRGSRSGEGGLPVSLSRIDSTWDRTSRSWRSLASDAFLEPCSAAARRRASSRVCIQRPSAARSTGSGSRCSAAGPASSRPARRFHQVSSSGLMVLGEPRPSRARMRSMVGRSPSRNSASAARSTSEEITPRLSAACGGERADCGRRGARGM